MQLEFQALSSTVFKIQSLFKPRKQYNKIQAYSKISSNHTNSENRRKGMMITLEMKKALRVKVLCFLGRMCVFICMRTPLPSTPRYHRSVMTHDRSCPSLGRQLFSNLSERLSSAPATHLMELFQ